MRPGYPELLGRCHAVRAAHRTLSSGLLDQCGDLPLDRPIFQFVFGGLEHAAQFLTHAFTRLLA